MLDLFVWVYVCVFYKAAKEEKFPINVEKGKRLNEKGINGHE